MPLLQYESGEVFELDEYIEDASYFAGLYSTTVSIRFSCFGKLFSIFDLTNVDPAFASRIVEFISKHGYTYVPAEVLDTEYTGSNPHLKGTTWWVRYFDYL